MTPARSLLIAMVAVALLIGARPIAGDEQFPRGLMSARHQERHNRSCTIETRPLSFGAYDPLAETDVDAIGQIIYTCGSGNGGGGGLAGTSVVAAAPLVAVAGRGQAGEEGHPHRDGAGQLATRSPPVGWWGPGLRDRYLDYNIYLDATHRTVWGTGEGPTQVYIDAQPPNGTPVIVPAFGRIFGRQDVAAGPYTDNVPVRILF